jgi:hypothetical protein
MNNNNYQPNNKQKIFSNMFVGILLYSVVLGFFNDYTDILHTTSYSVTFALAIVMQILTYLTFLAKDKVVILFNKKQSAKHKVGLIISVWLILFLSKFVFLAVIGIIFRQQVYISGFVGLLIIVVCITIVQKIADIIDNKLAE